MRSQVRQHNVEIRLRHVHDAFQRRGRNRLPFLRLHGAAQDFKLRFVPLEQAGKEMAVQPVQIVDRIPDAEARVQIEQKMRVSQRPREIEQNHALLRVRAQSARPDSRRRWWRPRRLSIP